MPPLSELGALRVTDPVEWAIAIRTAMRNAGGRVPAAAEELGCSRRQLYRWLQDAQFADVERAPEGNPEGSKRKL